RPPARTHLLLLCHRAPPALPLSLHDALPISQPQHLTNLEHRNLPERHDRHFLDPSTSERRQSTNNGTETGGPPEVVPSLAERWRSEEHTSELQSRENLVCRLLLEQKNNDHEE